MTARDIDENEIRKTIATLKPNNQLFEVRLVGSATKFAASGYFTDAETLIRELKRYDPRCKVNVFITLNEVAEECYAKAQRDCFIQSATTTSDSDIVGLQWVLIDLDPIRKSGISSTDEQLKAAKDKAGRVYTFLRDRGWKNPVIAESGNGCHLLYKIAFENGPGRKELVQQVLETLALLFKDDEVDIDTTVFNPSRICKLYGTRAVKGSSTEDRPHRMSKIIYIPPEGVESNSKALLDDIADLYPKQEAPQTYNSFNPQGFSVEDFIQRHSIEVTAKESWAGGTKWILDHCPFDDSHRGKDASIIQTTDGKLCFHCFHNSCSDKRWKDLRMLFEPDAYTPKAPQAKPNYTNSTYKPEPVEIAPADESEPVFFTTEEIRNTPHPDEEFIRCGVNEIDRQMRGLKKGFVTLISGLRASGKSSIISQITLECRQQGYRVALFSGELTAQNLLKWLVLQAAGRNNTAETQFEGFYNPKPGIEETVSKWLNEFVWVYNNNYGNDFRFIIDKLQECTTEHKVDLVILDNLMALNIDGLGGYDKYDRQSNFVDYLERFAKKNNIHILFVAHPRKSNGFLRLEDVSGSNDLVNRVDNAFIVHRVNEDFKRLTSQDLHWKSENPLYKASNVIEICKDRDGGKQDVFVPLYFEPETKRLRNTETEYRHYGWEDDVQEDSIPTDDIEFWEEP